MNALVLKTSRPQGLVGSNPTPSAIRRQTVAARRIPAHKGIERKVTADKTVTVVAVLS